MKNNLLLGMIASMISIHSFAQVGSDDPSFTTPTENAYVSQPNTKAVTIGGVTVTGEIVQCDSTSTTLNVSGACSAEWFSDSLGVNSLGTSTSLTVNSITSDTTVYLGVLAPDTSISMPLPTYTNTFTGNARGYWFQAPSDFNISGLRVPTNASSGNQSVTIVRFNTSAPPLWSGTTNDFTVLGLWQNVTQDTISACISINTGDFIGILGVRGNSNAYAPAPFTSTIAGSPVTLTRLGMQYDLATTAPQNLFQESASSLSLVEIFYGDSLISTASNPSPITLIAPLPSATTTTMNICQGDSVLLGGAYQSANGTFLDSLLTVSGCDSLATTILNIDPSYNIFQNTTICPGDSILIDGVYVSSPGGYLELLQTASGCDSTISIALSLGLPDATVTQSGSGVELTANNTAATYQWIDCDSNNVAITGATSQTYTATENGNYAVVVTESGCSDTSACIAVTTVGLSELDLDINFSIYPNPTEDQVNYSFTGTHTIELIVTDLNGKVLLSKTTNVNQGAINLDSFATGTYLLQVSEGGKNTTLRIVKK